MISRYKEYIDDIYSLWQEGYGYATIAQKLIETYDLNVTKDYFRKEVARIVKYKLAKTTHTFISKVF